MAGSAPATGNWYDGIVIFFSSSVSEIAKLLGIAEQDAPAIIAFASGIEGVIASFFPGAGAVTVFLATAADWVAKIPGFIKTVDGVIMSIEEALNIDPTGAIIASAPAPAAAVQLHPAHAALKATLGGRVPIALTSPEMDAEVRKQLWSIYPDLPTHVCETVINGHLCKVRGPAKKAATKV